MRKWPVLLAALLVVAGSLAWWSQRPEGDGATDRTARIVARAVSWLRQDSAARLLNAVLDTRAGRSGAIAVVKAEELKAPALLDPLAELIFHMHFDAHETMWGRHVDARDVCYRARFNYYGIIGEPRRMHCPKNLTPLRPIPLPPRDDPFLEDYLHPEDAP